MRFGAHVGLQNTDTDSVRALWRRVEDLGFDWISVWDHFYSADATVGDDGSTTSGYDCLEAVTAHTALALSTSRVRCGSLVYCAGYRHPAVLANAMATLDHLSGGRVEVGLGAGWHQGEYAAYGLPFPGTGERLRILDEYVQCVRLLLTEEVASFEGEHFRLHEARCEPKPAQARLPIWVGGGGEQVTLRIVARHADGWNLAFSSAGAFARKRAILEGYCAEIGRDPSTITRSVNLVLARDRADLVERFGGLADLIARNALMGSPQQIVDRIGEYRDAGADWCNLAIRAPFDDQIDRFAETVLPAFA